MHQLKSPATLGNGLHDKISRKNVHPVFKFIKQSDQGDKKYLLLIEDDLTSCTWWYLFNNANSNSITAAISRTKSCSRCLEWPVTDEWFHFIAVLLCSLSDSASARLRFTTSYCPWANERLRGWAKWWWGHAIIFQINLIKITWAAPNWRTSHNN